MASTMASSQFQAWIRRLPSPHSLGLSPPSIVYPESSYSAKTTRKLEDVVSSLPSPSPSPELSVRAITPNVTSRKRRRGNEDGNRQDSRPTSRTRRRTEDGRVYTSRPDSTQSRDLASSRQGTIASKLSSSHTRGRSEIQRSTAGLPTTPTPDVEIGRGIRRAGIAAIETRRPGQNWHEPIDISSFASSNISSSSLVKDPSSPLARRNKARITKSFSSPIVLDPHSSSSNRQPSLEIREAIPGSIVPSIEADDEVQRNEEDEEQSQRLEKDIADKISQKQQQQKKGRKISEVKEKAMGHIHRKILPSIENGEERYSFNNNHLRLLSSDDLSSLRHRLEIRGSPLKQLAPRHQSQRASSPREQSLHTPSPRLQSRQSRQLASLTASSSLRPSPIRQSSPRPIQPVSFDDPETDPIASLLSSNDSSVADLVRRILSLRTGKGVWPEEIAQELEAETRLSLSPAADSRYAFMFARSPRLGFSQDDLPVGQDSGLVNARHLLARSGPQAAVKFELRLELELLQGIVKVSRRCLGASLNHASSAMNSRWSGEVHAPLLDLAVRYAQGKRGNLHVSNMSEARLHPRYAPECATKGLINYAFALAPEFNSEFDTKLKDAATRLADQEREKGAAVREAIPSGCNPTDDKVPMRPHHPIATVFLELESPSTSTNRCCRCHHRDTAKQLDASQASSRTPTDQSEDGIQHEGCRRNPVLDCRSRLAIWVAAWHARLREFVDQRQVKDVTNALLWDVRGPDQQQGTSRTRTRQLSEIVVRPVIPLPMVIMNGAQWYLCFATEQGSSHVGINISQPLHIGSTDSLLEAYKLLAILRELVDWINRNFRSFLEDLV